jgi:hypothetical protein
LSGLCGYVDPERPGQEEAAAAEVDAPRAHPVAEPRDEERRHERSEQIPALFFVHPCSTYASGSHELRPKPIGPKTSTSRQPVLLRQGIRTCGTSALRCGGS